jgi:hypothetical protein
VAPVPPPRVPAAVNTDFEDLVRYLRDRDLLSSRWRSVVRFDLRRVHRVCFALATWDVMLPSRRNPARVILRQVRADAVNCIPLALGGNVKATALLERSVIEGCLKYVYFFDHPVELGWLAQDPKFLMHMDSLYEYASRIPRLPRLGRDPDVIPALRDLYWRCSREVHGRVFRGSKSVRVLSDIRFDAEHWRSFAEGFPRIGTLCNTLLYAFHRTEFGSFRLETRRAIQCAVDARYWKACLAS